MATASRKWLIGTIADGISASVPVRSPKCGVDGVPRGLSVARSDMLTGDMSTASFHGLSLHCTNVARSSVFKECIGQVDSDSFQLSLSLASRFALRHGGQRWRRKQDYAPVPTGCPFGDTRKHGLVRTSSPPTTSLASGKDRQCALRDWGGRGLGERARRGVSMSPSKEFVIAVGRLPCATSR